MWFMESDPSVTTDVRDLLEHCLQSSKSRLNPLHGAACISLLQHCNMKPPTIVVSKDSEGSSSVDPLPSVAVFFLEVKARREPL